MRCFLAYRVTGEDPKDLKEMLLAVRESLEGVGVQSYCTVLDYKDRPQKGNVDAGEIMSHAFSKIDEADFLLVIQTSEQKSEGMILEVGYCIGKNKPILIATKSGLENTYLPSVGTDSFAWKDLKDLKKKLEEYRFGDLC